MPPMFGNPHMAMQAGAPPSMNPGMPASPDQMAPPGPPMEPQGLPPDQAVAPAPEIQAMANQLYQQQQHILMLEQKIMELSNSKVSMDFSVQRNDDGRISGITATQGMR